MATIEGIQNPTLDQPDQPAVGNGIQNKTAAVAASSSSSTSDSFTVQYTTAGRPAAAADQAGRIIRVKDPGSPELMQVCITTSGGTYEWITVGLASS